MHFYLFVFRRFAHFGGGSPGGGIGGGGRGKGHGVMGELLFLARKSRWVESDALRTWRVAVSRAWRVAVECGCGFRHRCTTIHVLTLAGISVSTGEDLVGTCSRGTFTKQLRIT